MSVEVEKGIERGNENRTPSHPSSPDISVPWNIKQEDEAECGPINGTEGIQDADSSTIRSRISYVDPPPPPDGGVRAWTQVLGALVGGILAASGFSRHTMSGPSDTLRLI